jgi:hypothetical protein
MTNTKPAPVKYAAINQKYSVIANRLIDWEFKTQLAVDDDNFRREEVCFERVCELRDQLTKRELLAVDKHLKNVRGY